MAQYSVNLVSHNVRVKWYPGEDLPAEVLFSSRDVFRRAGWEVSDSNECSMEINPKNGGSELDKKEKNGDQGSEDPGVPRGAFRARRRAYDLIRANADTLNMFLTLTVSPEVANRGDYKQIIHLLNQWLDNRVRRKGLKYVVVPEHHADGVSVHFHGLVNADALQLVDSGHKRRGKTVYNIADYKLGFTTAIRVTGTDAGAACAGYIFKYMTKSSEKVGGRWFLHGGQLREPFVAYADTDYSAVDLPEFCTDFGTSFKRASGEEVPFILEKYGILGDVLDKLSTISTEFSTTGQF